MREVFNRIEDNTNQVSIEVEIDLYDQRENNPWLFSVFIKQDISKEDDALYEFLETKESLAIALHHYAKVIYAGMRVLDGWCELYFYAPDSRELDTLVKKQLSGTKYIYESNVVRDTKWDFYASALHPTELESHHIQSSKIIFLLAQEGDTLLESREVEHYVVFDTPSQKQRFLDQILDRGYSFKDDLSTDDYEHGIAIVKEHNISYDEVKKVVEELFELVQKESAYYEGWSTVLIQDSE